MSERRHSVRDWGSKAAAFALPSSVVAGLLAGVVIWLTGSLRGAHVMWLLVATVGVVYSFVAMVSELRRGRFGVDPLALLSLVGALIVREFLAAAIISVMFASGHALEQWASRRARREIASLLVRVPKSAHLLRGDDLITVDLKSVKV
ncbi:MAG TPA: hypothetical protein VII84_03315, partial [Acidimicrobiales bacterium]